jgi:hypothetical protein
MQSMKTKKRDAWAPGRNSHVVFFGTGAGAFRGKNGHKLHAKSKKKGEPFCLVRNTATNYMPGPKNNMPPTYLPVTKRQTFKEDNMKIHPYKRDKKHYRLLPYSFSFLQPTAAGKHHDK